MKAENIRINNLVTLDLKQRQELWNNQIHAQKEYFAVKTIYSDGDIALELDDEIVDISEIEIKLIPLTAEFLSKHTEFERFTGWDDMIFWAVAAEKDNNKRFELLECEGGFELPSGYMCKTVDELQNCYFFHYVYGRELEINL